VRPRDAAAFIVNESTGAILSSSKLTNEGPATMNGVSLTKWDATMPNFDTSVGGGVKNVGIVFALSGTLGWSISGSLSTVCAQPLVVCYSNNGSTGLVYMHGYSPTATGTATTIFAGLIFRSAAIAARMPASALARRGCRCRTSGRS